MRRTSYILPVLAAVAVTGHVVHAQSCLGYTAFQTAPFNVSATGIVGSDFGGAAVDLNLGRHNSGPFVSGSVGGIRYVSEPKENRISYGGTAGWERYTKDQLILCPFLSASAEKGSEVEGEAGPQHTHGNAMGVGIGLAFEQRRKNGPVSFNLFMTGRYERLNTILSSTAPDTSVVETGGTVLFGLGVRYRDALQVTPSFEISSFEGSNIVFNLRFTAALQFSKGSASGK